MPKAKLPIDKPLNKIIPTTLGVLVIALAAAISSFIILWADSQVPEFSVSYTSTPRLIESTSDWQTYKNKEYGFEFQYPKDWINSAENLLAAKDLIELTKLQNDTFYRIQILQSSGPPPETMDMELIETSSVIIDGYQASRELFQGRFENNKDTRYLRVFINEKDIFYHMDFNKNDTTEMVDVYDRILSTFKFIDSIDTSDWQTYKNEEYGFEIKIPGSFKKIEIENNPGNINEWMAGDISSVDVRVIEMRMDKIQYDYGTDKEKNIIISGIKARKRFSDSPGCGFSAYDIPIGEVTIEIMFSKPYNGIIDHSSCEAFEKEEQIISTFKLIDSIDTSDWQTYRNEEIGIEFQYPRDWGIKDESNGQGLYYLDLNIEGDPIERPSRNEFPYLITVLRISSFSKSTLEEWNKALKESLEKGESIGDPGGEKWLDPSILNGNVGTDCKLQRNFTRQHECKIVEINNQKFLRFIGSAFYTDNTIIDYRIVKNKTKRWVTIGLNLSVVIERNSYEYKYMYSEELIAAVVNALDKNDHGGYDVVNDEVFKQIEILNKVISTFKFVD